MKPRVFRWIDFLTFGAAAVLATATAVWAQMTPQRTSAYFVTWAAAAGFWFVYLMLLLNRLRLRRSVWYVTRHGLLVMRSNLRPLPLKGEVEDLTEETLQAWRKAADAITAVLPELRGTFDRKLRGAVDGLFCHWRPFPFEHRARPGFHFTGLSSGDTILVGYRAPLATTAFQHELGHVLMKALHGGRPHDENEFIAFTTKNGLPA